MSPVLVDTNIVSYRIKGDSRAMLYEPHLLGKQWLIAFMTSAELYRWALRRRWGSIRVDELRNKLVDYTVLPYDDEIVWQWAIVSTIPGVPMEPGDAWIAATALRHGLPLVTHNRRHFENIPGLQIVSESP